MPAHIKMSYDKKKHGDGYTGIYEYILECFGGGVFESHDIGSYQGDNIVFFKCGERYGLLNHCYGSCSGCDNYQACDDWSSEGTTDDLKLLADDYKASVVWYDTKQSFIDYCENKWLKGDAGYHIHDKDYVAVYTKKARIFANRRS